MTQIIRSETEITIEPAARLEKVVIWLHGLGADGSDFVPIVDELDFPGLDRVRFIFPHAGALPVTINGGMQMRAWYDILQADLSRRVDGKGVLESVERIANLISNQLAGDIRLSDIVLAGFSQGGVIALHTAMQLNLAVAGVMALSTYLPMRETIDVEQKQNVFLAHGIDDGIVPYAEALSSLDWLRDKGHQVEWHQYPMMHSVCAEEIADINNWLATVLGKPGK
jgi:phospholipase/carboxylesterase